MSDWKDVSVDIKGESIDATPLENVVYTAPYEYYMRRGNKYYFRNRYRKITITSDEPLPLIRGQVVDDIQIK